MIELIIEYPGVAALYEIVTLQNIGSANAVNTASSETEGIHVDDADDGCFILNVN